VPKDEFRIPAADKMAGSVTEYLLAASKPADQTTRTFRSLKPDFKALSDKNNCNSRK
jgi:hypothetical protein